MGKHKQVLILAACISQTRDFRIWQTKRVVWSQSVIAFANVEEESAFDSIPLCEISSIEQVNNEARRSDPSQQPQQSRPQSKSADSSQTRFLHALQIKTDPEGHNSGRTYYLQANSSEQCSAVCKSLSVCSRRARKAQLAKTRLRQYQTKVQHFMSGVESLRPGGFTCSGPCHRDCSKPTVIVGGSQVRRVYESVLVQSIIAVLIIVVSILPTLFPCIPEPSEATRRSARARACSPPPHARTHPRALLSEHRALLPLTPPIQRRLEPCFRRPPPINNRLSPPSFLVCPFLSNITSPPSRPGRCGGDRGPSHANPPTARPPEAAPGSALRRQKTASRCRPSPRPDSLRRGPHQSALRCMEGRGGPRVLAPPLSAGTPKTIRRDGMRLGCGLLCDM